MTRVPTHALATRLLIQAEITAVDALTAKFGGPIIATRDNLEEYAHQVYRQVLMQAAAGLWSELGVHAADDLAGLRVRAEHGNELIGEAPIVVRYDFSRTALQALVVRSHNPRRSS